LENSNDLTIRELIRESHQTAVEKGWWKPYDRNMGEQVALFHSELSEFFEDIRVGCQPYEFWFVDANGVKIECGQTITGRPAEPLKPCGPAVELADLFIRVADTCGRYGIDLEGALRLKLAYNKTRPFRHGNKTA